MSSIWHRHILRQIALLLEPTNAYTYIYIVYIYVHNCGNKSAKLFCIAALTNLQAAPYINLNAKNNNKNGMQHSYA